MRVRLHRAGDVAEDDQPAVRGGSAAEGTVGRVAAGRERRADEPAQVEHVAVRVAAQPPRAARRAGGREVRDQDAQLVELLVRQLGEVLVP